MAQNDERDQTDAWKRKYYDALEQSEGKEQQWKQADDLLRKTISRLTLAADGLDESLDRQLKGLRDAIRDRADSRVLHQRIEAMSVSLVRLDAKRTDKVVSPGPMSSLRALLEKLELPRGHARRVKALQKKLAVDQDSELSVVVADFAELIHEVLGEGSDCRTTESGASPGVGFIGRLFGRGVAPVETAAREMAAVAVQSAATDADLSGARDLLLHVLDKFQQHAPQHIAQLRSQAVRAASEIEFKRLVDQLAEGFKIELPVSAASGEHVDNRELLLQLLERMGLPAEFDAQVDSIKDRLEQPGLNAREVLPTLANLFNDMRARVQAEKKEIETFLNQLTDRLQDIDSYVRGSEETRIESYQSGRELDHVVEEQVRGIEDSVRAAQSLEVLKQSVQQRVDQIISHVDQHRRGEEQRHQEVEDKVVQLTERLREMETESSHLRERVAQEHQQAMTDALTGIPNRMAYQERLVQEVARWKRFNTPLTLLVWDVDRFKSINDEYGHKAGDKVLKVIAGVLTEQIRETDFFARFGGEEFVLLMTGTTQPFILEVADKLREAVSSTGFHFRGEDVQITISCGIAEFREGDSGESVFERADKALYGAKEAGRNRCMLADA